MRQYFNAAYCQLWREPGTGIKVCDLPAGSVLLEAGGPVGRFARVLYRAREDFLGWVFTDLLDEIEHPLPREMVQLPEPTHSLQDAAQYVHYVGRVQYNLCGEMCAAFLQGIPLEALLDRQRAESPSWWRRVFPNSQGRPTGLTEVLDLLGPDSESMTIREALWCLPILRPVLSPARLAAWLRVWRLIVGVRIDNRGYLRPSGILHWVVATECEPRGVFGGSVTLYNPYSNGVEVYSWREFSESVGIPLGAFVRARGFPT